MSPKNDSTVESDSDKNDPLRCHESNRSNLERLKKSASPSAQLTIIDLTTFKMDQTYLKKPIVHQRKAFENGLRFKKWAKIKELLNGETLGIESFAFYGSLSSEATSDLCRWLKNGPLQHVKNFSTVTNTETDCDHIAKLIQVKNTWERMAISCGAMEQKLHTVLDITYHLATCRLTALKISGLKLDPTCAKKILILRELRELKLGTIIFGSSDDGYDTMFKEFTSLDNLTSLKLRLKVDDSIKEKEIQKVLKPLENIVPATGSDEEAKLEKFSIHIYSPLENLLFPAKSKILTLQSLTKICVKEFQQDEDDPPEIKAYRWLDPTTGPSVNDFKPKKLSPHVKVFKIHERVGEKYLKFLQSKNIEECTVLITPKNPKYEIEAQGLSSIKRLDLILYRISADCHCYADCIRSLSGKLNKNLERLRIYLEPDEAEDKHPLVNVTEIVRETLEKLPNLTELFIIGTNEVGKIYEIDIARVQDIELRSLRKLVMERVKVNRLFLSDLAKIAPSLQLVSIHGQMLMTRNKGSPNMREASLEKIFTNARHPLYSTYERDRNWELDFEKKGPVLGRFCQVIGSTRDDQNDDEEDERPIDRSSNQDEGEEEKGDQNEDGENEGENEGENDGDNDRENDREGDQDNGQGEEKKKLPSDEEKP